MSEEQKKSKLKHIYEKQYKALLIIPFLILILAIAQIGLQYMNTGDFINRGVSLKGGITITIPEKVYDVDVLELSLKEKLAETAGDASVRKISQKGGLLVDASDPDLVTLSDRLIPIVEEHIGELSQP